MIKHKLFTLLVVLCATTALWAGNVISYTATEKLIETTSTYNAPGLYINHFNVKIISHEFSNGVGTITFDGEVTTIGGGAFWKCAGLTSVTIPNSVTTIGGGAFYLCTALTSVNIPNSVTRIEAATFAGCEALTSITIPNSVTWIGDEAFMGCRDLTSVNIPNGVPSIENSTFYKCSSLTSITIPNSVTRIGHQAFYKCSGLTSIVIPYPVKTIGIGAFENCETLGDIFIPASVDTIKTRAFLNCRLWHDVTCERDYPPESEENCFMTQKCGTLYYPLGSEDVFRWAKSESSKKEWAYAFWYYKVITARTAEVTNVEAYPTESDVEIAWPAVEGAATYTIEIRKGEQLIFVYVFDAKGRFVSVDYMPTSAIKRGVYAAATSTENTAPGWAYTIHGLDFNANYAYSVTAKDASEQVIDTKSGVFSTQGLPTSIDNIGNNFNNSYVNPTKSLRNGQVLIRKDGKTYNVLGQEL